MTNEELDEKVIDTLKRLGPMRFGPILAALGREVADMRAVDRSLQRLRKKKTIAYADGRWAVTVKR